MKAHSRVGPQSASRRNLHQGRCEETGCRQKTVRSLAADALIAMAKATSLDFVANTAISPLIFEKTPTPTQLGIRLLEWLSNAIREFKFV